MTTVRFQLGGQLSFVTEPSKAGCLVTLHYRDFTVTARGNDMAYTLPVDMQVHVQVEYVDAHGNPAAVDDEVTWASSDATIIAVSADATDSTKATVRAVGKVGQAQVTATADADLGEGIKSLVTTMDVTSVAGEAVAGTITPVGAAEPVPPV